MPRKLDQRFDLFPAPTETKWTLDLQIVADRQWPLWMWLHFKGPPLPFRTTNRRLLYSSRTPLQHSQLQGRWDSGAVVLRFGFRGFLLNCRPHPRSWARPQNTALRDRICGISFNVFHHCPQPSTLGSWSPHIFKLPFVEFSRKRTKSNRMLISESSILIPEICFKSNALQPCPVDPLTVHVVKMLAVSSGHAVPRQLPTVYLVL